MLRRVPGRAMALAALAVLCVAPAAAQRTGGGAPPSINYGYTYNAPANGVLNARANAVVISHGWTSDPTFWGNDMRDNIVAALGAEAANWDVWVLDWRQDASGNNEAAPANREVIRAQTQGHYVARTLLDQNSYQHIHLIGHSLGGRVVETAATVLRQRANAPAIHTTFLDAYTPGAWSSIYGSTSTWSEHIYNRDTGGIFNPNDALATEFTFPHSMNVDATLVHDAMPADYPFGLISWNHNWPQRMYRQSITGANNNPPPFAGYGYRSSKEFRGANWPPPSPQVITTRHNLNANGTVTISSIPPASTYNEMCIDLEAGGTLKAGGAAASLSASGLTIDAGYDASDMWARLQFTLTERVNFFTFDFVFANSDAPALLSVFTKNGNNPDAQDFILFQATSQHRLGGVESTGRLSLGAGLLETGNILELLPGTHTMAFRLEQFSDFGGVTISNICGGYTPIPSPGVAMAMGTGLLVCGVRRRRPARAA